MSRQAPSAIANSVRCLEIFAVIIATSIGVSGVVQSSPSQHQATPNLPTFIKGAHLSGGEYNGGPPAGVYGTNYIYPSREEYDYYKSINFSAVRISFDIFRLQPLNNESLNKQELARLKQVVDLGLSRNMYVILDPHNYGKMYNSTEKLEQLIGVPGGVPNSTFVDLWTRIAHEFKLYPNVIWGIMNEPHEQAPSEWKSSAIAAIRAIREEEGAGIKHLILIPGSCWTTASRWVSCGNAAEWTGYLDPAGGPFMFEMHQYLDLDFSGAHPTCSANWVQGFKAATQWLAQNNFRGFVGEFGWAAVQGVISPECQTQGLDLMNAMKNAEDQWGGWIWCCSGPWAGDNGSNLYNLEFNPPRVAPQTTTLKNYVP